MLVSQRSKRLCKVLCLFAALRCMFSATGTGAASFLASFRVWIMYLHTAFGAVVLCRRRYFVWYHYATETDAAVAALFVFKVCSAYGMASEGQLRLCGLRASRFLQGKAKFARFCSGKLLGGRAFQMASFCCIAAWLLRVAAVFPIERRAFSAGVTWYKRFSISYLCFSEKFRYCVGGIPIKVFSI